jgi:hypothetical protein
LIDLFYDDETYVFARQHANETVIVAFNRQNQPKQVSVPAGTIGLRDGTSLKTVIGAEASSKVVNGEAALNLPAQTAVAFKVF